MHYTVCKKHAKTSNKFQQTKICTWKFLKSYTNLIVLYNITNFQDYENTFIVFDNLGELSKTI